ncbi:ABC transporter permease [Puia dinghuensis]|uniref:ABC transporter permease n=1 Tax=Puia dinghuensis TaxID=1792502 RepID=A0A8J2XSY3_9BACT|nr:FtsX-like permease family protein [Puia dinghuensis]GGA94443.1 ABC transporter permease [Puia dinghuensis]
MLPHHLKTALRTLSRNKGYTLLNIIGLSVGVAACLLIFQVVRWQLSFDNFHVAKDRIYRVVSIPYKEGSGYNARAGVALPVASALRIDYPQLEKVAAIFGRDGQVTVLNDTHSAEKKFNEENDVYFAQPAFFDIFNFAWLAGNPKTALTAPHTVVLTKATAIKYFGDWQTAMGRSIKFDNHDIFKVTGVMKDVPANTDFPLGVVFSYTSLTNVDLTDWIGTYGRGYCFVRLPSGLDAGKFNGELKNFINRHEPKEGRIHGIALQPLAGMHFDGRFGNYNGRTFSKEWITSLILTAAFLLIIACVNFVNLATAQAMRRSQEVGVRKVLGSSRRQLMGQFMGETALITLLAVLIAVGLASTALPFFDQLLKMEVPLRLNDPWLLIFLGLVTGIVTVLSGLYPAFILSGFSPIYSLKNKITTKMSGGISLRRILTTLQFGVAQVLIICVLVASSQVGYFRNAPLGFDKASIVDVPIPGDSLSQSRMNSVRQQLLQQPGIETLSFSTFSPLDNVIWSNQFKFDHATSKTVFQTYFKWADAGFFATYQPQLIAGRAYRQSDTLQEFVVNETLVKQLGIRDPKDILGKEINFWDQKRGAVVGVVKDFQTNSMQSPITPVVLGCWKENYEMIGIKIKPQNIPQTLAAIKSIWNAAYPDYVYQYQFLDEKIDSYYKEESRLSQLYRVFAGLAILISCLGLYGLVSFMAVQRSREIGVRKVLGATAAQIIYLLSREFTILVGIAFLASAPLAWYLMHHWLEGFASHVSVGPGIFLLALACSLFIAWCTVGYRAFKAATTNPVHTLRTE